MTILEEDHQDAAIPQLAVEALNAATLRASAAGHTIVFVEKGKLIRKGASGIEVLKTIPARLKVPAHTKKARS